MKQTLSHTSAARDAYEQQQLFHCAARSTAYQPLHAEALNDDYRGPYRRDVDRILQSKAYARYIDKTQVVYLVTNDHISQRSLHVQLVSGLARGIAEALRLNGALVEAIALGHDVGHPPFGHEGEGYLSQITQQLGLGNFCHSWQSCRLFSVIEPLNLGLAVLDGILCHDGGIASPELEPNCNKDWHAHAEELQRRMDSPNAHIMPMTLEGCLVKMCDTVAYLTRDLVDAVSLGLIKKEQIPDCWLGTDCTIMQQRFAQNVISCSYNERYIAISQEVYDSLHILRQFSMDHIYFEPRLKSESEKICRCYSLLIEYLLEDARQGTASHLWKHFLHSRTESYRETTPIERQVVDYVAGMTDGYFLRTIHKLFVPSAIGLSC